MSKITVGTGLKFAKDLKKMVTDKIITEGEARAALKFYARFATK